MRRARLGHGSLLAAAEVLEHQGAIVVPREPVTYKPKAVRHTARVPHWLRWKQLEVRVERARELLGEAA
jgi:hypothetical protein